MLASKTAYSLASNAYIILVCILPQAIVPTHTYSPLTPTCSACILKKESEKEVSKQMNKPTNSADVYAAGEINIKR